MTDWKATVWGDDEGGWSDDGEGWEDVAAAADIFPATIENPHALATAHPKTSSPSSSDSTKRNAAVGTTPASAPSQRNIEKNSGRSQRGGSSDAQAKPVPREDAVKPANKPADGPSDLDRLTAAFAASEKKVTALTRERDGLRRARDSRVSGIELAKEKDKQIAAIMAEGEQLSIKIAEKESSLRTLKQTLKERETEINALKQTSSATEAKLEALSAKLRALEPSERAAQGAKDAAERRMRQMESDVRAKSASTAALDAVRTQLESVRKANTTALENQELRLRAEAEAEIEKEKNIAKDELERLSNAVSELRSHLTLVTESAGWKEDQLRKEMSELTSRAELLEARNEELAEALPGATRPLLRQVEVLQAAVAERQKAASAVERSQVEQLRSAEATVAAGRERERALEGRIGILTSRIAVLEEQAKLASDEKARISTEVRNLQAAAAEQDLLHQRAIEVAQTNLIKVIREKESTVDELARARVAHLDEMDAREGRESHLRSMVSSLEANLERARSEKGASIGTGSAIPSANSMNSALPSVDGDSRDSQARADGALGSLYLTRSASAVEGSDVASASFVESTSAPGGVYDTERLRSTLMQRREEIQSLQAKLTSKETASQALADEVVSLTSNIDELTKELGDAPKLRTEYLELKARHGALLEMLGEREERIQELEADLVDINQMYKGQVTDLLLQLEQSAQ